MVEAPESGRPDVIYKYLTCKGGIAALSDCTVQYTLASRLNDPFECQPKGIFPEDVKGKIWAAWAASNSEEAWAQYWREQFGFETILPDLEAFRIAHPKVIANAVEQIAQQVLERERKVLPSHTYLACFSEVNDSILMWSHYAENHKGLVIGYGTEAPFCQSMVQVAYQKERPYIPFGKGGASHPQWARFLVSTKSDVWSYEKEWRCILGQKPSPGDDLAEHQVIQARPDEIFELYLGLYAEAQLRELCHAFVAKFPWCELYQARLDEKEYKLVFDLVAGKPVRSLRKGCNDT